MTDREFKIEISEDLLKRQKSIYKFPSIFDEIEGKKDEVREKPAITRAMTSFEFPRVFSDLKYLNLHLELEEQQKAKEQKKKFPKLKKSKKKKYELEDQEHHLTVEDICQLNKYKSSHLQYDPNGNNFYGLTEEEAKRRLAIFGKNIFETGKKVPEIVKLFKQFTSLFQILLEIATVMCYFSYFLAFFTTLSQGGNLGTVELDNIYLGSVILVIVIVTAVFSYIQEGKSESIIKGFQNMIPKLCTVVRYDEKLGRGVAKKIASDLLVPGDVVQVLPGSFVPADMRILQCNEINVDNSCLTGECELVPLKSSQENTNTDEFNTTNMAYFGAYIAEGRGMGLVIKTGSNTLMGGIASLAAQTKREKTPLQQQMELFVRVITVIALTFGISFFFLYLGMTYPRFDITSAFIFCIGIIVANVPEGLLGEMTVSLSIAASQMKERNVFVKNLESIETLGCVTVICSDKTGTITQNKMVVRNLFFDDSIWKAEEILPSNNKKKSDSETNESFKGSMNEYNCLRLVGILCSKASFVNDIFNLALPIDKRTVNGDASEAALLKYFFRDPGYERIHSEGKICGLAEIPFSSANKFQCSVHYFKNKDGLDTHILVMKGAPEVVLGFCKYYAASGSQKQNLTNIVENRIKEANLELASNGERVLGFALFEYPVGFFKPDTIFSKEFVAEMELPRKDLTFVGFVSLYDPPKLGVSKAVKICREAGIKVIMITGDHPATAEAIAKQVGIISHKTKQDILRGKKNKMNNHFNNQKKIGSTMFMSSFDLQSQEDNELDDDSETEMLDDDEQLMKNVEAEVITGKDIENLKTEKDWDRIFDKKEVIFARTSPKDKLVIVSQLQRRKEVVAMTGDGVNDGPALKKANVGISMQISGSDVSKNAADMILMDDSFPSIVNGIEVGRVMFKNIQKCIAYVVVSNVGELVPYLLFVAFGLPLPLGTIHLLLVDVGTDQLPAISLALEEGEGDIMKVPPRKQADLMASPKLLGFAYFQFGLIQALAGLFAYAVVMAEHNFPLNYLFGLGRTHFNSQRSVEEEAMRANPLLDYHGNVRGWDYQMDALHQAQTAVFVSIVVTQIFNLFLVKSQSLSIFDRIWKNKTAISGIFIELLIAYFVSYIPFFNLIFGTRRLLWYHWLLGVPFGIFMLVFDEVRKFFMKESKLKIFNF